MSTSFEIHDNELWICYCPEFGVKYIHDRFKEEKPVIIKNVFTVNDELLREEDEVTEEMKFCISYRRNGYIQMIRDVIGTDHEFFFSENMTLKINLFLASRGISILKKIDDVIERDFYVGGDWENNNGIPLESYVDLINKFPKTAELDKYAHYRISNILKEYYLECDKYQAIYDKFFQKRKRVDLSNEKDFMSKYNVEIEIEQFSIALQELKELLLNIGIGEKEWQERIHDILQLLYPKYIYSQREVRFKGSDKYCKQPDFLLVDTNGYVDILEIKKADVILLAKYRNNYIPTRELSGAIQQVEKYTFSLNTENKAKEYVVNELSKNIPNNINVKVLNPQGILLLGRSNNFNEQQKNDFEIIKREYKNVVDIMTYDDLIERIKNIINSLKLRLSDR